MLRQNLELKTPSTNSNIQHQNQQKIKKGKSNSEFSHRKTKKNDDGEEIRRMKGRQT